MDPLDEFLAGPRATRAFLMAVEMRTPWAIEVEDEAALTVVQVTQGSAIVAGVHLQVGDVALVRGPAPYRVSDAPESSTTAVIGPRQECTTPGGEPLHERFAHGLRRWGNSATPDTVMIVGAYAHDGAVGRLLTLSLPPVMIAPRTRSTAAVSALLAEEVRRTGLGQQAILDRLLDALVVTVVREWVAEHRSDLDPSWLSTTDPIALDGLRAMHSDPASTWTVADLAARAHVSRATFAARFHSAVGTSPMAYLARWRLALAAERLGDRALTVAHVGRSVGYDNAFAFSTAFKRHHGVSPAQFREREADGTSVDAR